MVDSQDSFGTLSGNLSVCSMPLSVNTTATLPSSLAQRSVESLHESSSSASMQDFLLLPRRYVVGIGVLRNPLARGSQGGSCMLLRAR